MAYAEKRGKGPAPWRVKYRLPSGPETSESGFESKKAALTWGRDQEGDIRQGRWTDTAAGKATVVARGFTPFDGIAFDDKGNIYVSEIIRSELWVLSPDGSKRALVANKKMAPLDDNTSLAWYKGTICTANLGFTHQKPEQADKTIVCIRGYDMP